MSNKSTNVETNVVQMRFDNKNFEKNVSQTMTSLDALKKELNFDESKKSFKQLEDNARKVDFSPLSNGIEKVKYAFSFLDRFSLQVYDRLSNRLIDIGKKITAGVSTDGIKSGFNEYELKMNSFKTIKASAGKDFTDSQINDYLEELNRYADKTIYSFSDMTNNIGKFTNAGVKLDAAVKAIKGISNEAAVSGASAEEASRAMYNFSQALSAGYVKLIDWKSIENANMATEEFKTQLLETAAELKTVTKAADGTYKTIKKGTAVTATKNFNETLSEQWMTTEVLTKTLAKYANETTEIGKKAFEAAQKVNTFTKLMDTLKESIQSGWSQTWELVIGDLETASKLWTKISDVIGDFISKRFETVIKLAKDWNKHGGRTDALRAMAKILNNIATMLKTVGSAWREVFPKSDVNILFRITSALQELAKKTNLSRGALASLKDTARGIFATLSILKEAFTAFKRTFSSLFGRIFKDAMHSIFGVSGSLGQMLVQIKNNIKNNKTFYKIFESAANTLEKVYEKVKKVIGALWDFSKTLGQAFSKNGGFKAFFEWTSNMGKAIKNLDFKAAFNGIIKAIKALGRILDYTLKNTFDFYTPLKEKIIEAKDKIVKSKIVTTIVDIFKNIVNGIQKVFNSFRGIKTDGVDEFTDKTKKKFSFFSVLISFLKKVFNGIISIVKAIWNIAKPVVKFVGNIIKSIFNELLGIIRRSDLGDIGAFMAGGGLGALFLGIKNFFDSFSKIGNLGGKFGKMLKSLSTALDDASKLLKVKTLKEIATSILMLAAAFLILALIPQDKLASAIISIGSLFAMIATTMKSLSKSSDDLSLTSAVGLSTIILAISAAMVLLTASLATLSFIDYENAAKALIVMSTMLTMIVAAVKSISTVAAKGKSSALALVALSVLIGTLAAALTLLSVPLIAFSIIIAKQKNGAGNLLKATGILVGILVAISGIVVVLTKLVSKMKVKDVIKVAGVLYLYGTVFKKLATSIALIMGVIAVIAVLLTKKQISIDSLETAGEMFVAILAVLTGTIIAFSELSKQMKTGDLMKISALIGVISLMMTILSGVFIAVTRISPEKIESGTIGLGAITTAMVTILAAFAVIAKLNVFKSMGFKDILKLMLMMGAIMVPFTAAVTLLLMGLSVFIRALEKTDIDGNVIKASILMVVSMIAAISATIIILNEVAKKVTMKDALKLSLLVTVINALMLSLTFIVIAMSCLKPDDLKQGAQGLIAIAGSMVLIFTALRIIMGSAEKNKVGLVNGIKSIILVSIALNAIVGVLGALVYLAKNDSFDTAMVALLKISAAIVAVAYMVGKSRTLANGLKALSGVIATLSVAAAAFGVFVAAIIKGFTLLKDLTDEDLDRMEKNIGKFADIFKRTFKKVASIIATAVALVVRTIINTVLTTITSSSGEIFSGLLSLLDSLLVQAPELVNKALQLVVVVLSAIERSLAPVVDMALKTAISFIQALADGIRNHSDEILDAISNLIDAAAGLVAKAVTRVLGIKEWEAGYKTLKTIIKNFGSLLLTIFAIAKLKSKASLATGIIAGFVTKIKTFIKTLKSEGFGSAWNEMFGIDKLNTAWAQAGAEISTGKMVVSRGLTLLKGAITGAGIGLALGTIVKSFIDAKADAIDVTAGMAGDIDIIYKDLADKTKKTFEDLNKKKKEYIEKYSDKTEVYDDVAAFKRTLEQLIDSNGKILAGHETEVKNLVESINDKLGERLAINDGILQSLNDQGEAQKYSSEMLDKIIKKERMKSDLEVAAEENKENIKLKRELNEELAGWSTEQVEKDKATAQQFIDALKSGDIKTITNDKTFRELAEKYNFDYSGLTKEKDQATAAQRLKAAMDLTESSINTRRKEIINKISEVNGRMELYQNAQEAALKENTEAYNKYMAMLETGVSPGANVATRKQQALSQARSISNMIQNFEEGSYSKEDVEKAILSFNELVNSLDKEGVKLGDISGLSFENAKMSYDDFVKEVGEKFAKLPDTVKYAIDGMQDEVEEAGSTNIGIPLGEGVFSGTEKKITTDGKTEAKKNVSAMVGDWRYAADVNSPSKVMRDEVGAPLGEGILAGISEMLSADNVSASVQGLVSKLQSTIFPAIAGLTGNSIPFGGITPVNFGLNQNGSGIYGTQVPLNGALPYDAHLTNITTILQMHSENMMAQTNTIITEIGLLRGDVTALGAHIDDMELRLDGDALVGGITQRMNDSLMRLSSRTERGL